MLPLKYSPQKNVFSAHAEVVPRFGICVWLCVSILRARGGSSYTSHGVRIDKVYSPRTRR